MLIRRSNLMVPITKARFVSHAWRHNADAITLDLEDGVVETRKAEARTLVQGALAQAGQGAAEVFVRLNRAFAQADIEASVWPGLTGIMLSGVETAQEVGEAAARLTALERQRGLVVGSLQVIVLLESARGVWHIRSIITASPRVTQVGLDESDLAADLGISPLTEYDPYVYARGRLAIEATAARVQPVGMRYPLGTRPRLLAAAELHTMTNEARNLGMKGVICPHPSWVEPVNRAFTPTADLVADTSARKIFAEGVAAGTAAVPLDGRMIHVPVDEWAKVVIAMAEACAARDAQKQAALARLTEPWPRGQREDVRMSEHVTSMAPDLPPQVTRVLHSVVEAARSAFGTALRSVILYGSGAEGRLRATSDVNLILVLSAFERSQADQIREPLRVAEAAIRL